MAEKPIPGAVGSVDNAAQISDGWPAVRLSLPTPLVCMGRSVHVRIDTTTEGRFQNEQTNRPLSYQQEDLFNLPAKISRIRQQCPSLCRQVLRRVQRQPCDPGAAAADTRQLGRRRREIAMARSKVPVTMRAVIAHINRKLRPDDEVVKVPRGRWRNELGDFYILNFNRNWVVNKNIDPRRWAASWASR